MAHDRVDEASPDATMQVTVATGTASREVRQRSVQLPLGTTLGEAMRVLGLGGDGWTVAVWGRVRHEGWPLEAGDRIEVLRALSVDPMEARRRRHAHQRKTRAKAAARKNTDPAVPQA